MTPILLKGKKDIVERIVQDHDLSRPQAEAVLNSVLAEIRETLEAEGELTILGFGKFGVKVNPSRKGRNPATNEEIEIPEKKSPFFKPAKALKDAVNG